MRSKAISDAVNSARPVVPVPAASGDAKGGGMFTNVHPPMSKMFTGVHPAIGPKPSAMNKMFTNVHQGSSMFIRRENAKTNPSEARQMPRKPGQSGVPAKREMPAPDRPPEPSPPRSLSYIQLAAARLIVAGHRGHRIAAHLDVTPQTLCRWKRDPRFRRELERLRIAPGARTASGGG
jgi:hypothetical protein